MALARPSRTASRRRPSPRIDDVANTIVFLGSDESARLQRRTTSRSRTACRCGRSRARPACPARSCARWTAAAPRVLVAAGDQVADALDMARVQAAVRRGRAARTRLGRGRQRRAGARSDATGHDRAHRPGAVRPQPRRHAGGCAVRLARQGIQADGAAARRDRPAGLRRLALPRPLRRGQRYATSTTSSTTSCAARCRVARELNALLEGHGAGTARAPRVVFISNGDDGAGNVYADILRAAIEELMSRLARRKRDADAVPATAPSRSGPTR